MHLRLLTWSIRHRRARHLINATIIAITVAVVVLFVSVVDMLTSQIKEVSRGRVIILPMFQGVKNEVPEAFGKMFEQIDGVRDVQCQKITMTKPKDFAYMISGERLSGIEMNQDLLPVTPDVIEAWKNGGPTAAILTETMSNELNLPVGKEAELPTSFGPLKIKVVGLSRGGRLPRRMAVHLDYLRELSKNTSTCSFRVFADPKKASLVANAIVEKTRNTAMPTQTMVDTEMAQSYVNEVRKIPTLLGFLGIFLTVTTALTLANATSISVRERRIEMAAMRVMGFRPRTVAAMVLFENLLVGIVGAILGIGVLHLVVGDGFAVMAGGTASLPKVTIGMIGAVAGLITGLLIPLIGAIPSTLASIRTPLVTALRDSA